MKKVVVFAQSLHNATKYATKTSIRFAFEPFCYQRVENQLDFIPDIWKRLQKYNLEE